MKKLIIGTITLLAIVGISKLNALSETFTIAPGDGYKYMINVNAGKSVVDSVNASSFSGDTSVAVYTNVQRKGGLMNLWQSKGNYTFPVAETGRKYSHTFNLGTADSTRAFWGNSTENTKLTGIFSLD